MSFCCPITGRSLDSRSYASPNNGCCFDFVFAAFLCICTRLCSLVCTEDTPKVEQARDSALSCRRYPRGEQWPSCYLTSRYSVSLQVCRVGRVKPMYLPGLISSGILRRRWSSLIASQGLLNQRIIILTSTSDTRKSL